MLHDAARSGRWHGDRVAGASAVPAGSMARIQKGEARPMTSMSSDQGPEGEVLAGVEVGGGDGAGLEAEVSVEDSLDHGEHVGGGEDDSGGGEGGPEDVVGDGGLHGAGEDQELADEAVEHGQADDGERGDDEDGHHPGELCGEAAVVAHVVGRRSARRGGRAA